MAKLVFLLQTLAYGWLFALVKLLRLLAAWLRRFCEPRRGYRDSPYRCVPINQPAFVKPDPLIYDQYYLASLGLAVTWDNPDIELLHNGVPIQPHDLKADTTYSVVARIWNASPLAPVAQMPVSFSYLAFGIGTKRIAIGGAKVNLGVKGSASHPAFATVPWHTPSLAGHYCLLIELLPPDDLNFKNNLGQENTDVGVAQSPAVFQFPLRNDSLHPHRYRLQADGYVLPAPDPCAPRHSEELRLARLARHRRQKHPVPAGWSVQIVPDTASLAPDESAPIQVTVTPPAGFTGSRPVNVNAFREDGVLAGGVTLTVLSG
jgi:hypothetical protein